MSRFAPVVMVLVLLGTLLYGAMLLALVARDGLSLLDVTFVAAATWGVPAALLGLAWVPLLPLFGSPDSRVPCYDKIPDPAPRCAVLYPVYKEPVAEVMKNVVASWRSLKRSEPKLAARTCYCILSDSPASYEQVERETVREYAESECMSVFYRRRKVNQFAKQGNVHEFLASPICKDFDLVVGLDADSYISGPAISRLVRVMRHPANRDVALIQQPTYVHRANTLISAVDAWCRRRMGVVGGLVMSRLLGGGNYYGHNFIARSGPLRRAMAEGLASPIRGPLPGLNGYMMSHDYSDGIILGEHGFRVLSDDFVADSFEETPSTLDEYIRRERRWCRGVLQWAVGGWGFRGRWPQRLVMIQAIHTYLSCPMGTIALICGLVIVCRDDALLGTTSPAWYPEAQTLVWSYTGAPYVLLCLTAVVLFVPGIVSLIWNVARCAPDAGVLSIARRFLLEFPEFIIATIYGFFVGPIVSGATAIACVTVSLSKGSWIPPNRDGGGYALSTALLDLLPIWLAGVVILAVAAAQPADVRPFLLVLGLPLTFTPITAWVVSSPEVFRRVQSAGLFGGVEADAAEAPNGDSETCDSGRKADAACVASLASQMDRPPPRIRAENEHSICIRGCGQGSAVGTLVPTGANGGLADHDPALEPVACSRKRPAGTARGG